MTLKDLKSPENSVLEPEENKRSIQDLVSSYKKLFSKAYIKITVSIIMVKAIQVYLLAGYAYTGFLYFMPELLSNFPTSQAYLIILFQQISTIPGSFTAGWLVETRLGRKRTLFISYIVAGTFIGLLVFSREIIYVRFILGRNIFNLLLFYNGSWIWSSVYYCPRVISYRYQKLCTWPSQCHIKNCYDVFTYYHWVPFGI